jgi:hypothetical protein
MKATDKKELLNDLLRDESYSRFRSDLCDRLRAQLRRQRTLKKAQRLLTCAACLILALGIFHHQRQIPPVTPTPTPTARVPRIDVVRTIPLRSDQIVMTAVPSDESAFLAERLLL